MAAGWFGALVAILLAWREARFRGLLIGLDRSLNGLGRHNPGVWRFSILLNLNSSVDMIPTQLGVIIVGALLGPAAVGIFRIGRELGNGMIKPVDLVRQSLYPDLARLATHAEWDRLTRASISAGALAAAIGAGVTLLIVIAGRPLVSTILGGKYVGASPLLVAVAIGTCIRVSAFAADPVLNALSRPDLTLLSSAVSACVFVGLLVWRVRAIGIDGAQGAFVMMGPIGALLSATFAVATVRRRRRADC